MGIRAKKLRLALFLVTLKFRSMRQCLGGVLPHTNPRTIPPNFASSYLYVRSFIDRLLKSTLKYIHKKKVTNLVNF